MFRSGGGATLGRHSAGWETFWCIRAQHAQKWPDGWELDMMNLSAVPPGQESLPMPTNGGLRRLNRRACTRAISTKPKFGAASKAPGLPDGESAC